MKIILDLFAGAVIAAAAIVTGASIALMCAVVGNEFVKDPGVFLIVGGVVAGMFGVSCLLAWAANRMGLVR